jgi:hypothetical protein
LIPPCKSLKVDSGLTFHNKTIYISIAIDVILQIRMNAPPTHVGIMGAAQIA